MASGKVHGRLGNIQIQDSGGTLRDLSADVTDIDGLPGTTEMADATGLGSTAKSYVVGLNDVKFSLKGFFNDTALTGSHTVLSGIRQLSGTRTYQYGPAGTTTGNVKVTGNCRLSNYRLNSPVGGIVTFQADFVGDGDVTFGVF